MAYLPLSTANLPDPAIDPAQGESPEDYFNTVLYTGNDSTNAITGVGFQPDWVWLKVRSVSDSHRLIDAVRGDDKFLSSNNTGAESDNSGRFVSFDSDGFTVSGSDNAYNDIAQTYVAWNWKAGGTAVANTDGTIPSQVSANTESGFSIVSYTGDGTNGTATVGHGLSSAPDMVIVKNRDDGTSEWMVWTKDLTNATNLQLQSTSAEAGGSNIIEDPDSTTVDLVGNNGIKVNKSGDDYIMYCFHSVEGFSKFGSYTGNGSTDGPFVYTGFRPAFVIGKKTSGSDNWYLMDTKRLPFNSSDGDRVFPNLSNAESTDGPRIDFVSNGFKIKTSAGLFNDNGATYIYMVFADDGGPFKYSVAR